MLLMVVVVVVLFLLLLLLLLISHSRRQKNQVRGHRTGSNNSGVEEYHTSGICIHMLYHTHLLRPPTSSVLIHHPLVERYKALRSQTPGQTDNFVRSTWYMSRGNDEGRHVWTIMCQYISRGNEGRHV